MKSFNKFQIFSDFFYFNTFFLPQSKLFSLSACKSKNFLYFCNHEAADEWDLDSESELPVSVCSIGVCQHVKTDVLEKIVRNKEKKLTTYKNLHNDIDEFWLVVYVNMHEYDYFKNMEKPQINSSYDSIYLTHLSDKIMRVS